MKSVKEIREMAARYEDAFHAWHIADCDAKRYIMEIGVDDRFIKLHNKAVEFWKQFAVECKRLDVKPHFDEVESTGRERGEFLDKVAIGMMRKDVEILQTYTRLFE